MLTLLMALTTVANQPIDFRWLAGYWLSCDRGTEVSETWSDMRAGMLLGTTFTFRGGEVSFEHMRILPGRNGYVFHAEPSGQQAADFRMVSYSNGQAVFENPQHDFPQRVIYRRVGDTLIGRIEGTTKGKPQSMEWRYKAAKLNDRCGMRPAVMPRRPKKAT